MGAPVATSLSNRATDFGVTFNLKTDFGAACNGVTDDTTAIQNWLNKTGTGVHLVAPGGTCNFSTPLTIPHANGLSIIGAGQGVTIFQYTGAATTPDLLTIADTYHGWSMDDTFEGFTVTSSTAMTDGFAIHAHGLAQSRFVNVTVGKQPSSSILTKIAGGFWFDGVAGIFAHTLGGNGSGISDGVRVNGALGAAGDLMLDSPAFGMFANGLHMAGGFGGLQCAGVGDIRLNGTDLLIDNSVTGTANYDFEKNSGCAFDGAISGDSIVINDTQTTGGFPIFLNGWLGASWYGSTVNVQKCQGCFIYLNSALASLSCQDGVYIQDQSAYVYVNEASQIRGNGANGFTHSGQVLGNGTCATGTGRGYGVNSTNSFSNFYGNVMPVGNSAGSFKNIAGFASFGPPVQSSTANGAIIAGSGASWDVILENGLGQVALDVPTGTRVIQLNRGLTVSALPTCNVTNFATLAAVTDATSSTYGAAPVGGGSTKVLLFCNGSQWLIH